MIGLILLAATSEGAWWALVGGWWRDELRYRTVLTVLLAVGAAYVIELVARALAQAVRRRSNDLTATEVVAGVVVVGLLGATGQLHGAQSADWVRRGFDPEALIHPPWLTAAERDDLEALADAGAFPADAVVYGVPASGAGLLPAVVGVQAFFLTDSDQGLSADAAYVAQHFSAISSDPYVCEILDERGGVPLYYEDDDTDDGSEAGFPGFADVDTVSGFELLGRAGSASVWVVTACR